MFSTCEAKPHAARKRMLSNVYSKSYVNSSVVLADITKVLIRDRLLPKLSALAQSGEPFDIFPILSASTMDFVTSYLFGLKNSSDFLRNDQKRDVFLAHYTSRHIYNLYPQELPRLTRSLKNLGYRLVPSWVDAANEWIQDWALQMCDGAADILEGRDTTSSNPSNPSNSTSPNVPEVYRQLTTSMAKSSAKLNPQADDEATSPRLAIASEVLDHLAAGFDTSGITLVYFVHELSQRPDLQHALRQELASLQHAALTLSRSHDDTSSSSSPVPSARDLDSLPLLQAMLQETLRLRSAIPGPEPRITPPAGCVLGPDGEYSVPGGVRVSAQPHSLHRNPEVFEDPERWRPERWLEASPEELKEMNRWFWAFSSGGRMCIGSHLAIYREFLFQSFVPGFHVVF
jgi:cytochrome P450